MMVLSDSFAQWHGQVEPDFGSEVFCIACDGGDFSNKLVRPTTQPTTQPATKPNQ
jgi:hypothetical protein